MNRARVDGGRLWDSLMEMAELGATPRGGVDRQALTDADRAARERFAGWCEDAGCTVTVDAIGNLFARRPGRDPGRAPVVTGSHLDSQPTGGRFDGVFGVLAGLEVVRALNDAGVETEGPVEVVNWTNEEGARFAPGMLGSGVFAGVYPLDWALHLADAEGHTVGEELARIGFAGPETPGDHAIGAYLEAHIEQGPLLEARGLPVGVVTGVQALRWFQVTVHGEEAHAGTTPMDARRDALLAAARVVQAVAETGREHRPHGRATVGRIAARPGTPNVVPGGASFTVDMRHPDEDAAEAMEQALRQACHDAAAATGTEVTVERVSHDRPTRFHPACVDAVRAAAESLEIGHMEMVSGGGHDAVHVAAVAPAGMVFAPCERGISHNEAENAAPDDLAAACDVLLHAILRLDANPPAAAG